MIYSLGAHFPVLLGSWGAVCFVRGRSFGVKTGVIDLVLLGQIYFSVMIGLGMGLGCFGALTPGVGAGACAVVGVLMVWVSRRGSELSLRHSSGAPAGVEGTAPVFTWLTPWARLCPPLPRLKSGEGRYGAFALAAVLGLAAFHAVLRSDYDYDILTYHLVFPAKWVQTGTISIVPTWFGDPAPAYAPSATEVYYAWLMLAFGGDALARCGQFPLYLLLVLTVVAMGRELRLTAVVRYGVALAVTTIPAVIELAGSAMVDVAMAAHVCAVALFSLRLGRGGRASDAVGLALALGLMLGTKFLALPYLMAMSPLVVWAVLRLRRPTARLRLAAKRGLAGAVVAALVAAWVGGFWYVRNWVVTGNPVYPLEVTVLGTTVFPGAFGREQMRNSPFQLRQTADWKIAAELTWDMLHAHGTGVVPLPARVGWGLGVAGWIIVTCVFMSASILEHPRRWRRWMSAKGGGWILIPASAVLLLAVYWWVAPYQQARFLWGPMALALVSGGGALSGGWTGGRAGGGAWAWLAVTAVLWGGAFHGEWAAMLGGSWHAQDARRAAFDDPRWMPLGEAWRFVDENLHGVTIAYTGHNVPYFLMGRRLENRVIYMPADMPCDGRYDQFAFKQRSRMGRPPNTATPAYDRFDMDPVVWLENLRAAGARFVFVTMLFPKLNIDYRHDEYAYPEEFGWLRALSEPGDGRAALASLRVFAGGKALLFELHWERVADWEGLLKFAATLPAVHREETDALDQARRDGTPPRELIRHYPYAHFVIEEYGLKALGN